jgi:hypothetical protein
MQAQQPQLISKKVNSKPQCRLFMERHHSLNTLAVYKEPNQT